jgi:hypothetical protein
MNAGNHSDGENLVPANQNMGENEKSQTHSESSSDSVSNGSHNNDFVIWDGFPALRLPGNVGWNIKNEEPIPNHSFRVEPNLLNLSHSPKDENRSAENDSNNLWESLLNDATTVFTARTRDDAAAYSVGTTYFCPAQMKPRCALEELVLSIYRKHTHNLPSGIVIPEQSGAEWWTLVLDQNNDDNKDEGDDEDDDDDVGMHFDADYGLEDQAPNLLLHPRLATVTYLTSVGAPTLILDQRSPPPADVEKKTLQGSIRRGWLSHPYKGKHISFDGRLLHGAPSTFFPPYKKSSKGAKETTNDWGWDDDEQPPSKKARTDAEQVVQSPTPLDQKRITLLVNVWINHCPLDAEPLEDEIIDKLVTPWKPNDATGDEKEQRVSISWIKSEDDETLDPNNLAKVQLKAAKPTSPNSFAAMKSKEVEAAGEEEVVIGGRLVTISYGASMEAFHTASEVAYASKLGCIELELDREVIALTVGEEVEDTDESEED